MFADLEQNYETKFDKHFVVYPATFYISLSKSHSWIDEIEVQTKVKTSILFLPCLSETHFEYSTPLNSNKIWHFDAAQLDVLESHTLETIFYTSSRLLIDETVISAIQAEEIILVRGKKVVENCYETIYNRELDAKMFITLSGVDGWRMPLA